MGSSCISKQKDILSEHTYNTQASSQELGILNINQPLVANFQQIKLLKENLEEGFQISNIQSIVISPRCESDGAKIVSELLKFGNQITIISKKIPENPITSVKTITQKGILKNKQKTNITTSVNGKIFSTSSQRNNCKSIQIKE